MRCASFFSSCSTTLRTTARAVSLVVSGMTLLSDSRVPTRCTSASTAASISGSSSSADSPSRSMASRCITCTTDDGKYVRMSPSQRATPGAEAPSPAERLPPSPPLAPRPFSLP